MNLRRLLPDGARFPSSNTFFKSIWTSNTGRHETIGFDEVHVPSEDFAGRTHLDIGELRVLRIVDDRIGGGKSASKSTLTLDQVRLAADRWIKDSDGRAGYWGYTIELAGFRVWGALLGGDYMHRSPSQSFTDLWASTHEIRRFFFVADRLRKNGNEPGYLKIELGVSDKWIGDFAHANRQVDFGRGVDILMVCREALQPGEESLITVDYSELE